MMDCDLFVSGPRFMPLSDSRRHGLERIRKGNRNTVQSTYDSSPAKKKKKIFLNYNVFSFFFLKRDTDGVLHMQTKEETVKSSTMVDFKSNIQRSSP